MLFNSIQFFVFFAILYVLYRLLPFRAQNWMLLVAGYVFYGAWDVRFLFLIAFSTCVDFWIGLLMARGRLSPSARWITTIALIGSALVFLIPDWRGGLATGSLNWDALLRPQMIGLVGLAASAGIAVIANASHASVSRMAEAQRRKTLIWVSVLVNIGFLAIFKYCNFFIDSANDLLSALGLQPESFRLNIILPVGISFYTFQSLSYTIDVARGRARPTERFFDFALFVAYFPPMVAGPIERARHILPQLQRPRRIRLTQSMNGVSLILLGLVKKVAIADGIAPSVNAVFNATGAVGAADIAGASILFAVQIFCDFSGYSDIARGVSKLLGIELMVNFRLPYFSQNPSEFWRRWHISLSSWLRDYLYIGLGGNRKGEARTLFNLMATMVLGGLWHGAAWNFVLWGFYQGVLLCGHRILTAKRHSLPSGTGAIPGGADRDLAAARPASVRAFPRAIVVPAKIGFFMIFVIYGWLLFRANSLEQITAFTVTLAGFGPGAASFLPSPTLSAVLGMALLAALQLADYLHRRMESYRHWSAPLQGLVYALMILIIAMGISNAPVQFIYFQF